MRITSFQTSPEAVAPVQPVSNGLGGTRLRNIASRVKEVSVQPLQQSFQLPAVRTAVLEAASQCSCRLVPITKCAG